MRAIRIILLWLGTVGLFALYGWLSSQPWEGYRNPSTFYQNIRFEKAVAWGAVGAGVASCVVVGFLVVATLRTRHLASGLGILLGSAVLAPVVTFVLLCVAQVGTSPGWRQPIDEAWKGVHLFQGEAGWWLLMAPVYAFCIALAASVVFFLCILDARDEIA